MKNWAKEFDDPGLINYVESGISRGSTSHHTNNDNFQIKVQPNYSHF